MRTALRFAFLLLGLVLGMATVSAQSDTVRLVGLGRTDTTCFVFPEDGGAVTASRCATVVAPPTGVFAHAYGRWSPTAAGECTKEQHDAYQVVGPDGKIYPTWHPPVHPSGCFFGHEHGRDPSGSDLGVTLPFGYANEVLMDAGGPTQMRHEDHVGHKVEWINDVAVNLGGQALTCDVLVKLHQGTHSKDAFTNSVHEMFYHAACSNGLRVDVQLLTAIGPKGEFTVACDLSQRIMVGAAVPPDSPAGMGDSRRRIPTVACGDDLSEQWSTFTRIFTADGKFLADFNPYLTTHNPSRTYDATDAGLIGRPAGAEWSLPASPYRGDSRRMAFNRLTISTVPGEVWYTDAYGQHASATPFPNSIKQILRGTTAAGTNGRIAYLGQRSGDFRAAGVRAPN